MINHALNKD